MLNGIIFGVLIIALAIVPLLVFTKYTTHAQEDVEVPHIVQNADHFKIDRVFTGINDSTNMAFLGPNDLLVLERESGKVDRIVNGQILDKPLIDVNAYYKDGLIGIATSQNQNGSKLVFLYYNEAPRKYGKDVVNAEEAEIVNRTLGYESEGDRLYRYELVGNTLVSPKILVDLHSARSNKIPDVQHHVGSLLYQ